MAGGAGETPAPGGGEREDARYIRRAGAGLSRDGGEGQLTDELIGSVVAAVGWPARRAVVGALAERKEDIAVGERA